MPLSCVAVAKPMPLSFSDDFNRANSASSLGSDWTNKLNAMGINGNSAYVANTLNNEAAYNRVMNSDNYFVKATVAALSTTPAGIIYLLAGMPPTGISAGDFGVIAAYWPTSMIIYSCNGWGGTSTGRASYGAMTIAAGDVVELRRYGKIFAGFKNGVQYIFWFDSTVIVPQGLGHRSVGIGGIQPAGASTKLDDFVAQDIPLPAYPPFDDFNRADTTNGLASTAWVEQYPFNSYPKISGNALVPGGGNSNAQYVLPMRKLDLAVSIVLKTVAATYTAWVAFGGFDKIWAVTVNSSALILYTAVDFALNGFTNKASILTTVHNGDTVTLKRVGTVVSVLLNGVQKLSWDDTAHFVPLDFDHTYVSCGANVNTPSSSIDSFSAVEV